MTSDPGHRQTIQSYLEVGLFVGLWTSIGYLLSLNAEAYLLLGIPLTILFQHFVRRRPLHEVWVRYAPRFRLDRRGVLVAGLLAGVPAFYGVGSIPDNDWILLAWWAAAVSGAVFAAFALRWSSVKDVAQAAAWPTAIASLGWIVLLGGLHITSGAPVHPGDAGGTFVKYLAIYFPLTFVLEEVVFRGALDPHVQGERGTRAREWSSAVFVSALWGLWHLPLSGDGPLPLVLFQLLGWQILVGVPLSFAWRRSHNLAGPALAHAAGDAVRNALMLGL